MFRGPEMEALRPLLAVQRKWSHIPARRRAADRAGEDARGLAPLRLSVRGAARARRAGGVMRVSARAASRRSRSRMASNDYGFELAVARRSRRSLRRWRRRCFSPDSLVEDIQAALNATEMARRQFRELARVAGLVFPGLPEGREDRATAAGVERTVLRRAAAVRSRQPAAVAGRARSAGAPAREHAARRDAAPALARDGGRQAAAARHAARRSRCSWIARASACRPSRSADRIRRMQLALERAAG